jgi:hypothetical protein
MVPSPESTCKSAVRSVRRTTISSPFRHVNRRKGHFAFLGVLAVFGGFAIAAATPAYAGQNKIGSATLTLGTCDSNGVSGGTCYRAVVTNCPEATGQFAAEVKINSPANQATSKGTVFFTTGGGGVAFYDYDQDFLGDSRCSGSNCGQMVVQNINAANYRTVQIKFTDPENLIREPSGWLTGPATDGPRALACRYATIVHAVWSVLLKSDTTHPVCATGNSAGGGLVAYAITQYGMGNTGGPGPMFSMVEPTSGPPYGRVDRGCAGAASPIMTVTCPSGTRLSEDFGLATASDYVDPAYPSSVCTTDINSNGTQTDKSFWHDSVLSDDFSSPSYKTVVRTLYGSDDLTAAVPLGLTWYNAIRSSKSGACISGAAHQLPANFTGASTIVSDVISLCK